MVIGLLKEKEPCTSSSRNLARSDSCKKHKNFSRQACSFLEGNLRRLRRNTWEGKYDTREKNLSAVLANSSNHSEGDIGVCGIGQFFMRYFGNFIYCGVLRICGMRYFWRFGQRYLIKKKLFYTVSDPLTFVRDSCHSQAIRKSMPSKLSYLP